MIRFVSFVAFGFVSCFYAKEVEETSELDPVVDSITVVDMVDPAECPKYNRDSYKHWISVGGECSDVRAFILNRDNISSGKESCIVDVGTWICPFTGDTLFNKSDIDIDHLVPLKEADVSGAFSWSSEKKEEYANYIGNSYHLLAVDDGANQSKSDKDPAEWLPMNAEYHKTYVLNWVAIKVQWGLTADVNEIQRIKEILGADTLGVQFPKISAEVHCTIEPTLEDESNECDSKKYCNEMASCEEAQYFLNTCGLTRLDSDSDGIPCESICN